MNILLTGIDGYIGSVLAPILIAEGYDVTGLDTGFYRDGTLFHQNKLLPKIPRIINKDLRSITADDVQGFDAIIHMAELSNDPLGENNPDITFEINHKASVRLANLAKQAGVARFIYTSSCSVYGCGSDEVLDETSATNPQTAYAKCKTLVEQDVGKLADDKFSPVFLRNATAYGASPRMRFDIVLNNLCGHAWTNKKIAMTSDGSPWRPLVHIDDICLAIKCCLDAPIDAIHKQVFNVGHNHDNYRVVDIANIISNVFTDCDITMGSDSSDNRSYKVSFDKICSELPGFHPKWNAKLGAEQLHELFTRIHMTTDIFENRAFTRLNNIKYLRATEQLDEQFFWRY